MTTYTPTTWTNNMPITNAKLNKIEDRIEEILNILKSVIIKNNNTTTPFSYLDINSLIDYSIVPIIGFTYDNDYSFVPQFNDLFCNTNDNNLTYITFLDYDMYNNEYYDRTFRGNSTTANLSYLNPNIPVI